MYERNKKKQFFAYININFSIKETIKMAKSPTVVPKIPKLPAGADDDSISEELVKPGYKFKDRWEVVSGDNNN